MRFSHRESCVQTLKSAVALLALTVLVGCFSSTRDDESLDVSMPQDKPKGLVESDIKSESGALKIARAVPKGETTIQWQHLFRPPPTENERDQIRMKLDRWENRGTPESLLKRGRNELAIGRLAAAEATFREILRVKSRDLQATLELAQIYLRRQDLVRCFEFLSELRGFLDEESGDRDFVYRYKYTLAMAYIESGDRKKGHRLLSELLAIDKSFTPGYAALASSFINQNKLTVAEFIAKRGLDRGHEDASLYNLLGVVAERKFQFTAAERWYQRSLQLTPTFAPALINRANLKIRRGDYKSAEKDLVAALGYQPNHVKALTSLGICQLRSGQIEKAEGNFSRAIDIEPDSAPARYNLGILMVQKRNKPNVAMRLFQEVLQSRNVSDKMKALAQSYLNELNENDGG